MPKLNNIKVLLSYSILLFVNFIFSYKYLSRYTEYGLLISILIFFIQVILISYSDKLSSGIKKISIWLSFPIILSICFLAHLYIPVESLNVDRWSVITSFWTELANGNYPYFAKSHMDNFPGPMPIYFIIAYPFYLLRELNILSVLGYIWMIIILGKKTSTNKHAYPLILILLTSVFLYWEIISRSNIFTYSFLVLIGLSTLDKLNNKSTNKDLFKSSILTGLLLSTRSIFVLVYSIFYISKLKLGELNIKKISIYGISSALVFSLTFIPMILLFKKEFFEMNPFIIQSSFLIPSVYIILFAVLSIILSLFVQAKREIYFYSGLSLFFSIIIYSLYHIIIGGFGKAFINSDIDISYFIFCLPFYMYFFIFNNKKHEY